MREKFVVYWHYTVLEYRTINAYSKAEAQHIMEQRFKTGNYNEPVVDSVLSVEQEQEIMD